MRRCKRKIVVVGVFRRGGSLSANILVGRDNSQQPRWSGKTRYILVLYGVEILTDDYLVLSSDTDRQTDRIATAIPCVALHAVAR